MVFTYILFPIRPEGLALLGNTLFVPDYISNTVGEYDATTGAAINANFITGASGAFDVAVSAGVSPGVPEPSTWSMIAVGGVALAGIMLRKKSRPWRSR